MKPLDKKQIPQVAALAVLALAFFAYFAMKLILPSPAAAGTQTAPLPTAKAPKDAKALQASADTPSLESVSPPAPNMHDPFVPALSDQPAPAAPVAAPTPAPSQAPALRTARLKSAGIAPMSIPFVPSLPSAGVTIRERRSAAIPNVPFSVPPMPVAPVALVAPDWTVTGVLQSGSEQVAILRRGDSRRFVEKGDFVDNQFVVTSVTRDAVMLRHGSSHFTLFLGASKASPANIFKPRLAPVKSVAPAETASAFGESKSVVKARRIAASGVDASHRKPWRKRVPALLAMTRTPSVVARLPKPRIIHHDLLAFSHQSLFSQQPQLTFPSEGRLPAALLPRVARSLPRVARSLPRVALPRVAQRHVVCPVVRLADYQVEKSLPLFPGDGVHGLLPSGMEAPDFSLSTLNGQTLSLSQFRGSVVVVDFWASWYAPSMRSLDAVEQIQKEFGTRGVTVLGVNSWDSKEAMQSALQNATWDTTMLYDPSVSNESVAVRDFHAPDVPACYVIDQQGRIAGAFVGYGRNTDDRIKATLAKLGII